MIENGQIVKTYETDVNPYENPASHEDSHRFHKF